MFENTYTRLINTHWVFYSLAITLDLVLNLNSVLRKTANLKKCFE